MKKIIDISSNSVITNSNALKNYDGVYIKATEGGDWISPTLDEDVGLCIKNNIPFGFYHYAGKIHTAQEEYNFFHRVINSYKLCNLNMLPNCLDYEQSKEDFSFIKQFMSYDNNMIFYSYRSLWRNSGIPSNKTWIANPSNIEPSDLSGFLGIQYKLNTNVTGINNLDISMFDDSILNNITIDTIKESVTMQLIKKGENSKRVKLLQAILNTVLGLPKSSQLEIDGIFGTNTENAVKQYQKIMGLAVDGIVGTSTLTTLLNDLKTNWFNA